MAFLDRIAQLRNLTFLEVVKAASLEVPRREWSTAWAALGHGRTILEDEYSLNKYLIAYGLMHRAKILHMLDAMKDSFGTAGRLSIVDWGCGQGLASAVFIDWLRRNIPTKRVSAIRLVEVSNSARARALSILKRYSTVHDCLDGDVKDVRWIPDSPITLEDLDLPIGVPVVHLYSNILDVEAVNRTMLAELFNQSRQTAGALALCVSPQCPGAEYMFDFFRLVGCEGIVTRESGTLQYDNPYSRKCSCTFTGCGFIMPSFHTVNNVDSITHNALLSAVPTSVRLLQTFESIPNERKSIRTEQRRSLRRRGDRGRTYALGFASSPFRDAMRLHPGWWTYNLALTRCGTPCDGSIAGLSPFLAVLNNMIVRGKASYPPLKVEQALTMALGVVSRDENTLGTIDFKCSREAAGIVEHVLGSYDPCVQSDENEENGDEELEARVFLQLSVPMMVARVQQAFVRALMTGGARLDIKESSYTSSGERYSMRLNGYGNAFRPFRASF